MLDVHVKAMRVEQDRQSVVLELRYGRHATDFNRTTTWWRSLWRDSEPHETHFVKMHRPILKGMTDTLSRLRLSLGCQRLLPVLTLGVTYQRPSNHRLAGCVASQRRYRHRLRVVPYLELVVVRGVPNGGWRLPSPVVAPAPQAQNPREGMARCKHELQTERRNEKKCYRQ